MPGKHSLPAKLTRPAATGLVRRERLFKLLDRGLKRRIVWVSGPGGAGKTSLVSTYLDERRLQCVWYQFDAGDADLATFFHYLRLAARGRSGREPLPMFSPAHLTDLDVFSRRFFEAFFARLGNRVTLVFDDYQVTIGFVSESQQYIRAGKLVPLAVLGPSRVDGFVDVPTMAEAGLQGMEIFGWNSFVAPAGTPPDVVQRLNVEIAKAAKRPDAAEWFAKLNAVFIEFTPEEFGQFIRSETAKWRKIAAETGIKAVD